MQIKTQDLTRAALRWAVAAADGRTGLTGLDEPFSVCLIGAHPYERNDDGERVPYCPDEDWSQGGPIIEREKIDITYCGAAGWAALGLRNAKQGPTPLIAAMRCFVASKLGDEVDVPDELA